VGTFLAQPHCFPVAEWECMTISSIGEVGPQYNPSRYIAEEEQYLQRGQTSLQSLQLPLGHIIQTSIDSDRLREFVL